MGVRVPALPCALGGAVLALAVATGCAANTATTSLRMSGAVPDAAVTIDDEYVGVLANVQKRGVALPPGQHRVTVERAGYFPWDRLVEAEGERIQLDVQMVKIPD
jgi:hypothetical protein